MNIIIFLNDLRQAVGDKLYSKNSAIWQTHKRMTFSKALRKQLRSEQYDVRPPKGQRTIYPPIDYESIASYDG